MTRWVAAMNHAPLYEEFSPAQRRAVTAALEELVAPMGPDIVATEFGKNLGGGLIELRLRQGERQLLKRVGKAPMEFHLEGRTLPVAVAIMGYRNILPLENPCAPSRT
ncbi:hypothetical protein ACQKGO_01955 [Corallococcus interemptor]|uniref:hypothetical protein n=1 Tax=Corallococcus interemptor TaxID=2316720 RepID=UPI003D074424